MLRKDIPDLETRTPEGNPGVTSLSTDAYNYSSAKAEKVLRVTFRSKEETFVELAKQLVEIEKGEKA